MVGRQSEQAYAGPDHVILRTHSTYGSTTTVYLNHAYINKRWKQRSHIDHVEQTHMGLPDRPKIRTKWPENTEQGAVVKYSLQQRPEFPPVVGRQI